MSWAAEYCQSLRRNLGFYWRPPQSRPICCLRVFALARSSANNFRAHSHRLSYAVAALKRDTINSSIQLVSRQFSMNPQWPP